MVEAAYEACKHASRPDATTNQSLSLATDVLKARRINKAAIEFTPTNIATAKPGQDVVTRIRVSSKERTYTGLGLFNNRTIEVTATMQKE